MAEGFTGMAELIADLQALGPNLERDAAPLVRKHAEAAGQAIRTQYPNVSGNLRSGVSVREVEPLRYRLRSRAFHAHLYEDGTKGAVRELLGRGRYRAGTKRGIMPEADPKVFVPTVVRWREQMKIQLQGLGRRAKVRGMTGTLEFTPRGD